MALLFDANTEVVDCGSGASLDDLDPITILCWYRPNAAGGTDRHIVQKGTISGGTGGGRVLGLGDGTSAVIYGSMDRATSGLNVTASSNALSANTWHFIAVEMTSAGVNSDQKLYVGTETVLVVEVTSYSAQTVGSGAVGSNASVNQFIGSNPAATIPANGDIAWVGIWNKLLTLAEIQDQQFFAHLTSGCVLFMRFDNSTTGAQLDQSGFQNKGTVSGTTTVSTIADPTGVKFDRFSKQKTLRPRMFMPGLPR